MAGAQGKPGGSSPSLKAYMRGTSIPLLYTAGSMRVEHWHKCPRPSSHRGHLSLPQVSYSRDVLCHICHPHSQHLCGTESCGGSELMRQQLHNLPIHAGCKTFKASGGGQKIRNKAARPSPFVKRLCKHNPELTRVTATSHPHPPCPCREAQQLHT